MIIRILTEGQYEVDDAELDRLNELDTVMQDAVERDDRDTFGPALSTLLATVREAGKPLSSDTLCASELVLPAEDMELRQVRGMLGREGLIPG